MTVSIHPASPSFAQLNSSDTSVRSFHLYTPQHVSQNDRHFKTLIPLLHLEKWTVIPYYQISSMCPHFPNCLVTVFDYLFEWGSKRGSQTAFG